MARQMTKAWRRSASRSAGRQSCGERTPQTDEFRLPDDEFDAIFAELHFDIGDLACEPVLMLPSELQSQVA